MISQRKEVIVIALELKREDSVYVMTMSNQDKGNMFNETFITECHQLLDEVEASNENAALVVTSSHPKIWNVGMDLEWIATKPGIYQRDLPNILDRLFLRWAILNLPTVGCITGHTYGAGAILASALDFRLMRQDKGWFCVPAVNSGFVLTPIMQLIMGLLPNAKVLRYLLLTGEKLGGTKAAEFGIVDQAHPPDEILDKSMELAEELTCKDRSTYAQIKLGMRRDLHHIQNNLEQTQLRSYNSGL